MNKLKIELPCEVGTTVWYKTNHPLGRDYIKCTVDSYKICESDIEMRLVSEDDIVLDIWINIENFEDLILLNDPRCDGIHLYQAVAFYDLDKDIKFEINELAIHHIEDDCTVVTKKLYDVENGRVSGKFAGVNSLHTMEDIKIADDQFIFYSINKERCRNFIFNHLSRFESKLCKYHERIYYLRRKLKEEQEC